MKKPIIKLAALPLALAVCLTAFLAAGISFLRGQRFAGRPFRPVMYGLSLVLVAVGGGYAYAHKSVNDWIHFGPQTPGFTIHDAQVGAGGRYLYLNVTRGKPWSGHWK